MPFFLGIVEDVLLERRRQPVVSDALLLPLTLTKTKTRTTVVIEITLLVVDRIRWHHLRSPEANNLLRDNYYNQPNPSFSALVPVVVVAVEEE